MGKNKHKKNSQKDESKPTDSPKASDGGADQKGTLVEIHEKAASDSSTAASPVKDGSDSPGKLSSKAVKMQLGLKTAELADKAKLKEETKPLLNNIANHAQERLEVRDTKDKVVADVSTIAKERFVAKETKSTVVLPNLEQVAKTRFEARDTKDTKVMPEISTKAKERFEARDTKDTKVMPEINTKAKERFELKEKNSTIVLPSLQQAAQERVHQIELREEEKSRQSAPREQAAEAAKRRLSGTETLSPLKDSNKPADLNNVAPALEVTENEYNDPEKTWMFYIEKYQYEIMASAAVITTLAMLFSMSRRRK